LTSPSKTSFAHVRQQDASPHRAPPQNGIHHLLLEELVGALVAAGRSIPLFNATKLIEAFTLGKENTLIQTLEGQNS
jgi:hypothetical protein